MDGDFADSSGNGLGGIGVSNLLFSANGNPCPSGQNGQIAAGLLGAGACFDGDAYINLNSSAPALAFNNTDDFSVEARFRPDNDFTTGQGTLFSLESPVVNFVPGIRLFLSGGGYLTAYLNDDVNNSLSVGSLGKLSTGAFYHTLFVYDGADLRMPLYLNGIQQHVGAGSYSFSRNEFGRAAIGAFASGSSPFQGLIDEVVIYNTPLSSTVVKNNYCAVEALAGTNPLPDLCLQ